MLPTLWRRRQPPRTRSAGRSKRCLPSVAPLEERSLLSITIELNYSLDKSNFFNTPEKKALMQEAANNVAADITTNLAAITPGGGNNWTGYLRVEQQPYQDQAEVLIDNTIVNPVVPANTIIVYVMGYPLGTKTPYQAGAGSPAGITIHNGTQTWINAVSTRGVPGVGSSPARAFAPWGGIVLFNDYSSPKARPGTETNWFFGQTTAGLQSDQTDFLTVAEHEIGKVLGLGLAPSWFTNVNARTGVFAGSHATAVNGGQTPKLAPGNDYWWEGSTFDGQPVNMQPLLRNGTRATFTTLDYAALEDVGWTLAAPVVQFASASQTVVEGAPSVTVTVERTGGNGPATVQYSTANGSARAGSDYTAVSGTLSFAVGQQTATITVPLVRHGALGASRTFKLNLSDPEEFAALGATRTETVTIAQA